MRKTHYYIPYKYRRMSVLYADHAHQLLVELLSGVIAHLLLTVIHGGNFKNYRKVPTRLYRDRN